MGGLVGSQEGLLQSPTARGARQSWAAGGALLQGPTLQSLSCAQLDAQTVPLQFSYGEQLTAPAGVQVPLPSHISAGVAEPLEHDAAAHDVPAAYNWQCPLPSQLPSSPHVEAAWTVHWPAGAAVPAVMFAQVPVAEPVSAIVHATQVPVQAVLQQTPPTQKPLEHWRSSPPVHAWPFACAATHWPDALQYWLALSQSVSAAQLVLHAVALAQMKPPAQAAVLPPLQVPLPLQVLAAVSSPLLHDGFPHVVPDAASWQPPPAAHLPVLPQVPFAVHWPVGLRDRAERRERGLGREVDRHPLPDPERARRRVEARGAEHVVEPVALEVDRHPRDRLRPQPGARPEEPLGLEAVRARVVHLEDPHPRELGEPLRAAVQPRAEHHELRGPARDALAQRVVDGPGAERDVLAEAQGGGPHGAVEGGPGPAREGRDTGGHRQDRGQELGGDRVGREIVGRGQRGVERADRRDEGGGEARTVAAHAERRPRRRAGFKRTLRTMISPSAASTTTSRPPSVVSAAIREAALVPLPFRQRRR